MNVTDSKDYYGNTELRTTVHREVMIVYKNGTARYTQGHCNWLQLS